MSARARAARALAQHLTDTTATPMHICWDNPSGRPGHGAWRVEWADGPPRPPCAAHAHFLAPLDIATLRWSRQYTPSSWAAALLTRAHERTLPDTAREAVALVKYDLHDTDTTAWAASTLHAAADLAQRDDGDPRQMATALIAAGVTKLGNETPRSTDPPTRCAHCGGALPNTGPDRPAEPLVLAGLPYPSLAGTAHRRPPRQRVRPPPSQTKAERRRISLRHTRRRPDQPHPPRTRHHPLSPVPLRPAGRTSSTNPDDPAASAHPPAASPSTDDSTNARPTQAAASIDTTHAHRHAHQRGQVVPRSWQRGGPILVASDRCGELAVAGATYVCAERTLAANADAYVRLYEEMWRRHEPVQSSATSGLGEQIDGEPGDLLDLR